MREKSASTKKVKAQAQVEIKRVRSSLNLDLSLPRAFHPSIAEIKTFIERWRTGSP